MEHAVRVNGLQLRVHQQRKGELELSMERASSLPIFAADCQNLGIVFLELLVPLTQLTQLLPTVRSPAAAVENEHHVPAT